MVKAWRLLAQDLFVPLHLADIALVEVDLDVAGETLLIDALEVIDEQLHLFVLPGVAIIHRPAVQVSGPSNQRSREKRPRHLSDFSSVPLS